MGCCRHRNPVRTLVRRYKPIFRLLRIRPTFSGVRLPAANPHPALPLQARGGMAQEPEIGTDSPNLFRHCEVVPRGRLAAAPTMASLQTTRFMRHRLSGDRRGFREPAYLHNTDFFTKFSTGEQQLSTFSTGLSTIRGRKTVHKTGVLADGCEKVPTAIHRL